MSGKQRILVVGGAGYIGSHMAIFLRNSGYQPIVLDNLSTGNRSALPEDIIFYQGDAGDAKLIERIFHTDPFAAVIHFAAFTKVGESVNQPLKYYQNNVVSTLSLLDVLKKLQVKTIVFSSSAAVYGEPQSNAPMQETHGKLPLSPYGRSKWMVEQILHDMAQGDGFKVAALRYFNVAGADPKSEVSERGSAASNLIPIVLQSLIDNKPVTIFGNDYKTKDGTCIRDYIHVLDLCEAHLLALKQLETSENYLALNLGTGKGYSVLEVVNTIQNLLAKPINTQYGPRRSGDPEYLVADGTLAQQKLSWHPTRSDLTTIIKDAWQYELNRSPE